MPSPATNGARAIARLATVRANLETAFDPCVLADIAGHLTCDETDAIAAALTAAGLPDRAAFLLYAHGLHDEDPADTEGTGDRHYGTPCPAPRLELTRN